MKPKASISHSVMGAVTCSMSPESGRIETRPGKFLISSFSSLPTMFLDRVLVVVGVSVEQRTAVQGHASSACCAWRRPRALDQGAEASMLGYWNQEMENLPRVVTSFGGEYARDGVALAEVHEMGEATKRGRLLRRDTAGAVVVKHVPQD